MKKQHKKHTLEELEAIIDKLPGHIYWTDEDSVILGCNEKQAHFAGFTTKDGMIGKTDHEMPWREYADKIIQVNKRVMQKKKELVVEERIVLPDTGKEAYFLSIKTPRFDKEGNVIGILGISTDITEQKIAEKRKRLALAQAKKQRIKAEVESEIRSAITILAGSIAHDLRVPLASMSIIIDLFSKYWLDFVSRNEHFIAPQNSDMMSMHLEKIDSFPIKMKKLISEMNHFINITLKSMQHLAAGTLSYDDFVICHIEPCVKDAIAIYPFKKDEPKYININIHNNFSFLGYQVLFCRVIFNLIKNSLEQIEKNKKGEVFISTAQTDEFNLLYFKDTAGGASPEIVQHLFDGYKSTKKGGTGIGLSFCKLTMLNFDGDISCNSVEGDYIEFVLSFPKLDN